MSTVSEAAVAAYLKDLRLPAMAAHLAPTLRAAEQHGHPPIEVLRVLLEAELEQRRINQTRRRTREACFPYAKGLDGFDFSALPGVRKAQVLSLARCTYIDQQRSVILLGNAGTGKTHLAIALGREACRRGYRVRFYTAAGLANELIEAHETHAFTRFEKRWLKWDLVIVDEVGYIPFHKTTAELLFQAFSQRDERGSFLVTTNLDFDKWTSVFGDPQLTSALLDRLTYQATILLMNGESYRFRQTQHMDSGQRSADTT